MYFTTLLFTELAQQPNYNIGTFNTQRLTVSLIRSKNTIKPVMYQVISHTLIMINLAIIYTLVMEENQWIKLRKMILLFYMLTIYNFLQQNMILRFDKVYFKTKRERLSTDIHTRTFYSIDSLASTISCLLDLPIPLENHGVMLPGLLYKTKDTNDTNLM